jgi:outer membrane lipoprotein-sorting protein
MKHCAIFALGFIAAALVPAALAQDKEAEKLFRDMEKKIKGAKALEIVFTYKLEGKRAKGSLLLTNHDKARLRVSGHYYPGIEGNPSFELISDGKRFKTKGAEIGVKTTGVPYIDPEGQTTAGDTGKGFHAMLAVVLSRGGIGYMVYGLPYWIQGDGGIDLDPDKPESRMTVYDFKAGAAEKVGERKAKVLRYRFGKGGKGDAEITLWIDAENGLPLKRVFSNPKGVFVGRITETYSQINLHPKIDGKAFELPK